MKYSLRSLMIVVALLPPAIAFLYSVAGLPLTVGAIVTFVLWLFATPIDERPDDFGI